MDAMFTHQKNCVVVEQQQRRSGGAASGNEPLRSGVCVRACVRAQVDAVKWTTLPRFSVPPAVMVMPPPPPPTLESKFARTSVYSELIHPVTRMVHLCIHPRDYRS